MRDVLGSVGIEDISGSDGARACAFPELFLGVLFADEKCEKWMRGTVVCVAFRWRFLCNGVIIVNLPIKATASGSSKPIAHLLSLVCSS